MLSSFSTGALFINYFSHAFLQLCAKPLVDSQAGSTKRFPFFKSSSQEEAQDVKTDCELPVALFSPTLETLLLNHNNLHVVPQSVCRLLSLIELDLSK